MTTDNHPEGVAVPPVLQSEPWAWCQSCGLAYPGQFLTWVFGRELCPRCREKGQAKAKGEELWEAA